MSVQLRKYCENIYVHSISVSRCSGAVDSGGMMTLEDGQRNSVTSLENVTSSRARKPFDDERRLKKSHRMQTITRGEQPRKIKSPQQQNKFCGRKDGSRGQGGHVMMPPKDAEVAS